MVNLFKRLPVLRWLPERAAYADKELATSHHALEQRVMAGCVLAVFDQHTALRCRWRDGDSFC